MTETIEYELSLSDVGAQLNAFELGYFLYHFRALYSAVSEFVAFHELDPRGPEGLEAVTNEFIEQLTVHLAEQSSLAIARHWMAELPDEIDLDFSGMSMNSPLKFVGYATATSILILSLTVAVSGGTAQLGQYAKFELPPIAKSIREIREAFGANPPKKKLPSERSRPSKKRLPPTNDSSNNCA